VTVPPEFARSKQISLTTYRKDGTAVATPVWFVIDGSEIWIVSNTDAGKVKRIRRDGRVQLTLCDVRGRIAPDAPTASGTARLLDDAGTRTARAKLAGRYISSRVGNWVTRVLHLPKAPVIGIVVSL
jgi:PPOX class probable F420-dependent enzyme